MAWLTIGALTVALTPSAFAATSPAAVDAPARVLVRNADPVFPLSITVDGDLRARAVPAGRTVGLVLDAGSHSIAVTRSDDPGNGQLAPEVIQRRFVVAGRALLVRASSSALTVTDGPANAVLRTVVSPEPPVNAATQRLRLPATVFSIVVAILSLAALTSGLLAHLVFGRRKVRDERAGLRMQQLAQRSLDDLPPLTIGVAARKGSAGRPSIKQLAVVTPKATPAPRLTSKRIAGGSGPALRRRADNVASCASTPGATAEL